MRKREENAKVNVNVKENVNQSLRLNMGANVNGGVKVRVAGLGLGAMAVRSALSVLVLCASIGVGALNLGGCASGGGGAGEQPSAADLREGKVEIIGILQGGQIAIGGETTGWVLNLGDDRGAVEVDVTKVANQAAAAEGKRVVIAGEVVKKAYVTRGEVKTVVVESLVEQPTGSGRGKRLEDGGRSIPPPPGPRG